MRVHDQRPSEVVPLHDPVLTFIVGRGGPRYRRPGAVALVVAVMLVLAAAVWSRAPVVPTRACGPMWSVQVGESLSPEAALATWWDQGGRERVDALATELAPGSTEPSVGDFRRVEPQKLNDGSEPAGMTAWEWTVTEDRVVHVEIGLNGSGPRDAPMSVADVGTCEYLPAS